MKVGIDNGREWCDIPAEITGWGLMASDFITEHFGYQKLTDEEYGRVKITHSSIVCNLKAIETVNGLLHRSKMPKIIAEKTSS